MEAPLQVTVAAPSREEATRLTESAVEARLAACGQVLGPVASVYWWEGRLTRAEEWLGLLKTSRAAYPGLERHLRERHSYRNPEIVATAITVGSVDYLEWLRAETQLSNRESP